MKFVFTKYAAGKFSKLSKQGIRITKRNVLDVLKAPDHTDKQTDYSKIIVSKEIDERLVLRVVFRTKDDIITVITFYPARRGRYYEIKKN